MYWPAIRREPCDCNVDMGVLLRLARLDVCEPDVAFLGPSHQLSTDLFRAATPLE
jgi:hypothetical protein